MCQGIGGKVQFGIFPTDRHRRLGGRVCYERAPRRTIQQVFLVADVADDDVDTHRPEHSCVVISNRVSTRIPFDAVRASSYCRTQRPHILPDGIARTHGSQGIRSRR